MYTTTLRTQNTTQHSTPMIRFTSRGVFSMMVIIWGYTWEGAGPAPEIHVTSVTVHLTENEDKCLCVPGETFDKLITCNSIRGHMGDLPVPDTRPQVMWMRQWNIFTSRVLFFSLHTHMHTHTHTHTHMNKHTHRREVRGGVKPPLWRGAVVCGDRKSTRLNSSHL